jgi:lipid-A-disaccharide synthase
VTKVAAIFPFEAEVYSQAGADVVFVGHPLLDIVKPALPPQEARRLFGVEEGRPVVLLMPGSRRQEIERLLPVMLAAMTKVVADLPDCQFFLPVASTISREILQNIIDCYNVDVRLTTGNTYDLMSIADVAVAASGTATLETAIMRLPTVIVYKMATLTYLLGKLLVKIPDIGLPNIVAGRRVVPELVQGEANADNIARETLTILTDSAACGRMTADLAAVRQKLGESGAVGRVAEVVLEVAAGSHGGEA